MAKPNGPKTDIELEETALALDADADQHKPGSLEMMTRAEINQQIATARAFPRSITDFVNEATRLVTINPEIAQSCIYALPRRSKDGERKLIEGPSARFAEMIAYSFRNLHYGARPMAEDDDHVTAQGVCIDLERNNRSSIEVRRLILDKNGERYNNDMINVTANAANSIALRNAVLKIIPKALWNPIYQKARKVVIGDYETFSSRLDAMYKQFQLLGVTKDMLLGKLNKKGSADVKIDDLVILGGMLTSLREEGSTIEEMFADVLAKEVKEPKEIRQPQTRNGAVDQETETKSEARKRNLKSAPKTKKPKAGPDTALTPNMIQQITLRAHSYNIDMGKLLGHFQVNRLDDLEQDQMPVVLKYIEDNANREPGADG